MGPGIGVVSSLVVDGAYSALDPRVKFSLARSPPVGVR